MVELSPKARNPKSSMMTNQSPEQPARDRRYVFIDESENVDYSRGQGASRFLSSYAGTCPEIRVSPVRFGCPTIWSHHGLGMEANGLHASAV